MSFVTKSKLLIRLENHIIWIIRHKTLIGGHYMTKIGYARVSTRDQSLDGQIDTLEEYGCERIFSEKSVDEKRRELN